jgi:hypothetical protein
MFMSNGSLVVNNNTLNMDEHFVEIVTVSQDNVRKAEVKIFSALGSLVLTHVLFETSTSDRLVWRLEMPNLPQDKTIYVN